MFDIAQIHADISCTFKRDRVGRIHLRLASFIAYLSPIQNYLKWEQRFKKYSRTPENLALLFEATMAVAKCNDIRPINVKLLRIMSRMEETAKSFIAANGIDLIFHILKTHPNSSQIQIDSSAVIANLSNIPHARTHIHENNSYIPTMLNHMRTWAHEETVQTEMCAILSNLAQSDGNGAVIVQRGAMSLIRDAMQRHPSSEDLHVQGLNAMASLARTAKRQVETPQLEEYSRCITEAFTRWKNNVAVSSAACNCIGMFSFVGLKVAGKVDAIILDAMARFSKLVKFQITACFALAHWAACENSQARTGMDLEVIDEILLVIRQFPRQRNLLTTAVFAISAYAVLSEQNRIYIMEKDGIDLIVKSMMESQFDEEAHCLEVCMKHMSLHEHDAVVEPEAKSKTTSNSKLHLLKLFGSMCLMNISENEKCRQEIVRKGGLAAVFDAASYIYEKESTDLSFVMVYAFRKVSASYSRVYARHSGAPSLRNLCKSAALQRIKGEFDAEKPIFESFQEYLYSKFYMPEMMCEFMSTYKECVQCKSPFDATCGVMGYELFGKDKPALTCICSKTCLDVFDRDARKRIVFVDAWNYQ